MLEWVAISFSSAWKWKVKGKLLSHVWLLAIPWTAAYQAPPSMGFSRQEYWSGVPLPSPKEAWTSPAKHNTSTTVTASELHEEVELANQFSSVQSLSQNQLFVTPWTAACQASLSITNSQSLLKLMSIKSVMPSNHLTFCHPLLLLPSILPSIWVFSNDSSSLQVAKVLEFQLHDPFFQWIFRTDLL